MRKIEERFDIVEQRLTKIEECLKHIVQNELPHIWKVLLLVLGGIITILGALIVQFILR